MRTHKAILALTTSLPGNGHAVLLKGGPADAEDIILLDLARVTSDEIDATLAAAAAKADESGAGRRIAYRTAVTGTAPARRAGLAKVQALRALLSGAKLKKIPEFGNLLAIEIDLDDYR
jgi:hypothetical protein